MRVLTWNCHRASAENRLWDFVRDLAPDIALLQEVAGVPSDLTDTYQVATATPLARDGRPQRFRSVLLVKGAILGEYHRTSSEHWVADALRHFGANILGRRVCLESGEELTAVCVHAPLWPVPRAFYAGEDVTTVKLPERRKIWVIDLLLAGLRSERDLATAGWIVAGDFNTCETFDHWKRGPRGNRRWLEQMASIGLVECLRYYTGTLTPTFRRPGRDRPHCQFDYLFVSRQLSTRLVSCRTGDPERILGKGVSDHLPIWADFSNVRRPNNGMQRPVLSAAADAER